MGLTPSRDRVKRLFSVLLASYHGFDSQSRQSEGAFLSFISYHGFDSQSRQDEGAFLLFISYHGFDSQSRQGEGAFLRFISYHGFDSQSRQGEGAFLRFISYHGFDSQSRQDERPLAVLSRQHSCRLLRGCIFFVCLAHTTVVVHHMQVSVNRRLHDQSQKKALCTTCRFR